MPKEQRKRGRRAEKKRKKEKDEEAATIEPTPDAPQIFDDVADEANASTFYGLLTDEEQEYFKRADELLDGNAFASDSERLLFLENVHQEVAGKELKLAHSQGCSRFLERLILTSTARQCKKLFQACSGHFLGMVQHRFASHCVETLCGRCAPEVAREMDPDYREEIAVDEVFASMESLFLHMLGELQPELKMLLMHRFASHTVRMLLLLLSGRPVASAQSLVQSRKKENITSTETKVDAAISAVPQSFHDAVRQMLASVANDIETAELRSMAVHQIGSPTLQVVLQMEMGLSNTERKAREKAGGTLFSKLTGGWEDGDDTAFFQNLLYDPVGSHLAESIVLHAPKREFKLLYNKFMKERIASLARNETAAFVVQRVLERLDKEELEGAVKEIVPSVKGLVERSRVAVLKTLIEACGKADISTTELAHAISSSYTCTTSELLLKILHLTPADLTPVPATDGPQKPTRPLKDPAKLHGALLAQSMLSTSGELNTLITTSLLSQPPATLVALSAHPQASHVVQKALTSSPTTQRKLIHALRGRFAELALDTVGSHIVDACWRAPTNLRQGIAEELMRAEPAMRESYVGRAVWRNWSMDRFKTNKRLWFAAAREEGAGEGGKTPLELARERKAGGRGTRANGGWRGTGANKRAVGDGEMGGAKKKMRVR